MRRKWIYIGETDDIHGALLTHLSDDAIAPHEEQARRICI